MRTGLTAVQSMLPRFKQAEGIGFNPSFIVIIIGFYILASCWLFFAPWQKGEENKDDDGGIYIYI